MEVLVAGYLARAVRRVSGHETSACIQDQLRRGVYRPEDLAAYLDATPHVRAWPRELGDAVAAWLNTLHVAAAGRRKMVAWSAWRRRLRLLTAGDAVWEADLPHVVWWVVTVDAESGTMTVTRRDSVGHRYDQPVAGPEAGGRWASEAEAMPLLRVEPATEAVKATKQESR